MSESAGLGIDLGSLGCRFAVVAGGGPVPLWVPRQFDEALAGAAAADPVADSLLWKEALGSPEAGRGAAPFGPAALRELFVRASRAAAAVLGAPPARAVVAVPTAYSGRQRQVLLECLSAAGLRGDLVSDPVALAAARGAGSAGGDLLVYQCGYLGYEVAVLRPAGERWHVLASRGGESPSGRHLERLLLGQVVGRAPGPPSRPLRQAVARALECLEHETEVAVEVHHPGGVRTTVSIPHAVWAAEVRRLVEASCAEAEAALAEARLRPGDVAEVVLAGGTTARPVFREVFQARLRRPVTRLHGWSAAFGAARLAARGPAAMAGAPPPPSLLGAASPFTPSLAHKLAMRALRRAEGLLAEKRYAEAVATSHQAHQDDGENPAVLARLLAIHLEAARAKDTPEGYAQAAEWLGCAARHAPGSVEVRRALAERHLLHARQALDAGRPAEADAAAREALRWRPDSAETQDLLARIHRGAAPDPGRAG